MPGLPTREGQTSAPDREVATATCTRGKWEQITKDFVTGFPAVATRTRRDLGRRGPTNEDGALFSYPHHVDPGPVGATLH